MSNTKGRVSGSINGSPNVAVGASLASATSMLQSGGVSAAIQRLEMAVQNNTDYIQQLDDILTPVMRAPDTGEQLEPGIDDSTILTSKIDDISAAIQKNNQWLYSLLGRIAL